MLLNKEHGLASGMHDLIVCDVDGCLVSEGAEAFDLEALARIAAHNRDRGERGGGGMLTLCTGRPQPFAEAMCRMLGNLKEPCVCENGVWLYWPGENRYAMDERIGKAELQMVRDAERWLAERYGGRGIQQQPGKAASISLTGLGREVLLGMVEEVREVLKGQGWAFRVSMTWKYINCDLESISKGTGLRRLMEARGIEGERMAGIGDTESDKAIAEVVGWFGCPGNAQEAIKKEADYVAKAEEAWGVVEIVEKLTRMR